jgi:hypothetical protein
MLENCNLDFCLELTPWRDTIPRLVAPQAETIPLNQSTRAQFGLMYSLFSYVRKYLNNHPTYPECQFIPLTVLGLGN